ncbi:MAG: methyl-accepting chemotaxis protein [Gammaproteobacteria bacterium]|nr:methyl-accepting chemotaxis protein [Gammaproteobacteria bacterium]
MFKQYKIGTRIVSGFILLILVFSSLVLPLSLNKISELITLSEQDELNNLYKSALAEIASESKTALTIATGFANLSEVLKAMDSNNRESLSQLIDPVFIELKNKADLRQLQFHLPPAQSFYRAHNPTKFGDDLSGFRKTVVDVNRNKTQISGIEKGVAGLGIRGVAPLMYNGKHIGSVEAGMSFGQPFFEQFKDKYNVDISLTVLTDNNQLKPFASTMNQELISNSEMKQVLSEGEAHFVSELNGVDYATFAKTIEDFSGNTVGIIKISKNREAYLSLYDEAQFSILIISLMAFVGAIFIAKFVASSISKPINDAAAAMKNIAQGDGDLTQRLPVDGEDELATMSQGFNAFAEKVQRSLIEVNNATDVLSTSAEEMSYITQETRDGVRKQQSETELVATAMNEMTATVQEVAQNATEASNFAQSADEQALDGQNVVNAAVDTIVELANEIQRAVDIVNKVEKDSESIGSVLDVIRGIAEQTNLLALNAAIEAARAGEQGRGFAVVADEVRSLASRTQDSTKEIEHMIEQLQSGTREAGTSMQNSSDSSKRSVEHARAAGNALEQITIAVKNISDMNMQIATAAEEQSSVAEEININVVNINDIGNKSSEGAEQTHTASAELSELASRLQKLLSQFKV